MTGAASLADVNRFRELIALRLGLEFDDGKLGFLAEVLWRQHSREVGGCQGYLQRLGHAPRRDDLIRLAEDLTVPETYFFRHIDQFRAFSDIAVPDRMRARRRERQLRLLSVGCASGEEPYTLAIAIRELALEPTWQVSIRAVDVNRKMLQRAARGRFSSWSLRETPPILKNRWFSPAGREFLVDDSIVNQVRFEQRNLADEDPDLWPAAAYDVVFCRNVIMYFTPKTAQAVIDRIARSLAPGGYVFLGHAENLRGMSNDFHLCHTHGTFYYRRKGADEVAALPSSEAAPARWLYSAAAAVPIRLSEGGWLEAIGEASYRIQVLAQVPAAPAAAQPLAPASPPTSTPTDRASESDLQSPLELLRQERYGEALALLQARRPRWASDPEVSLLEAVLLAQSGQLSRAEKACRSLLQIDELNAGAHYVLALCCARTGDGRRAIEHDQIATYLDPAFAMPRLHLGLLARRAGEHADARRELGQALELLEREDSSRLLYFGGGFGREALVALCRAELVACGGRP